jgi:hypothetical protein
MVNGPHIHDPSGHRYGKGDLPIATTIGTIKNAVIAGRDKKRKELQKKQQEAGKTKAEEEQPREEKTTEEPAKKKTVQLTVGDNIPTRPSGPRPAPTVRGAGGKFEPNEEYGKRKQADTDFNAGLEDQRIIQNHSAAQFDTHRVDIAGDQKINVPGKPMRATGYGPTNPRTGTTNKVQMGTIQKTAQKIDEIRTRNAAIRTTQDTTATQQPTNKPQMPSD